MQYAIVDNIYASNTYSLQVYIIVHRSFKINVGLNFQHNCTEKESKTYPLLFSSLLLLLLIVVNVNMLIFLNINMIILILFVYKENQQNMRPVFVCKFIKIPGIVTIGIHCYRWHWNCTIYTGSWDVEAGGLVEVNSQSSYNSHRRGALKIQCRPYTHTIIVVIDMSDKTCPPPPTTPLLIQHYTGRGSLLHQGHFITIWGLIEWR